VVNPHTILTRVKTALGRKPKWCEGLKVSSAYGVRGPQPPPSDSYTLIKLSGRMADKYLGRPGVALYQHLLPRWRLLPIAYELHRLSLRVAAELFGGPISVVQENVRVPRGSHTPPGLPPLSKESPTYAVASSTSSICASDPDHLIIPNDLEKVLTAKTPDPRRGSN
jgi:hypothetical protein